MNKTLPISISAFSPLYSAAWKLARPFLSRHKRLAQGLESRLVPEEWALPFAGKTIWIEAASGGEAYLLVQIWRELKREYKGELPLRILGTTCTKQGLDVLDKAIAQDNESADDSKVELVATYFPFDDPAFMERAVNLSAPEFIVLLETELWPGLLMAAYKKSVPVLILNGRITPKSLAGYRIFPGGFWKILAPQKILAISQGDAARFGELFGASKVDVMPNIKFDLLKGVADADSKAAVSLSNSSFPPVVVFGSVRKQEAALVAESVSRFVSLHPEALVIIAPRHLHHAQDWQGHIKLSGRTALLRSKLLVGSEAEPEEVLSGFLRDDGFSGQVLIWDRFGELKKLYELADAVFVGGSFVPLGGQNFLEVIETGLRPCIGPFWTNFAWAGDAVGCLAREVSSPDELAHILSDQLKNPEPRGIIKSRFLEFLAAHRGGTKQATVAILDLLARK